MAKKVHPLNAKRIANAKRALKAFKPSVIGKGVAHTDQRDGLKDLVSDLAHYWHTKDKDVTRIKKLFEDALNTFEAELINPEE